MVKRRAAAALLAVVLTAVMVFSTGGFAGADPPKFELKVIINPNPGFEVSIWVDKPNYMPGEDVVIRYRVTQDAYVYIWDIDTQGIVRLLLPNIYEPGNFAQAGRTYTIPSNNRYRLQVTGPYGTETLVIVASKQPLPETGWLGNAIRSKEFMPKVGDSAEQFFGQVRSLQIQPIPQQSWVSAQTSFQIGPAVPVVPLPPRIEADVRVESNPSGARVFLDGREVGSTPRTVYGVTYGPHEVTILKDGYFTFTQRFNVTTTAPVTISAYLERIPDVTVPVAGPYGAILDQYVTVSSTADRVELPFAYGGSSGQFVIDPDGSGDRLVLEADGTLWVSGYGTRSVFAVEADKPNEIYWGKTYVSALGPFKVDATLVDYGIGRKNDRHQTPFFQYMTWRVQVWWVGR